MRLSDGMHEFHVLVINLNVFHAYPTPLTTPLFVDFSFESNLKNVPWASVGVWASFWELIIATFQVEVYYVLMLEFHKAPGVLQLNYWAGLDIFKLNLGASLFNLEITRKCNGKLFHWQQKSSQRKDARCQTCWLLYSTSVITVAEFIWAPVFYSYFVRLSL